MQVRHFRQQLFWPLQLMPLRTESQIQNHWQVLEQSQSQHPWREVDDEFTGDPADFQERHYGEFVTFLPHVRRFLYGDGKGRVSKPAESPIRVFRRNDAGRWRTDPDLYRDGDSFEYAIASGVAPNPQLEPLDALQAPFIDPSTLDAALTVQLMTEAGIL